MEVTVRGKHFEVPAPVEERARRKLSRLDHYLPLLRDAIVEVDVAQERAKEPDARYVVHVAVNGNGVHLRAEARAALLESAVDQAVHVLVRQAQRYKERLYGRGRGPAAKEAAPEAVPAAAGEEPEAEEPGVLGKVAEVRRVSVKPMTTEEAVEQIELLGQDFFLFLEEDARQFALLHRRGDGDYSLIIPELS